MHKGQLFINGKWLDGAGETFSSINPSNNQSVWSGHTADTHQVEQAVLAARDAFESFSLLELDQRLAYINRFGELLDKNKLPLAQIISQEVGKPVWEAKTEVVAMIGKVAISIKAYHERTGFVSNQTGATTQSLRHKPHGVLAVYGPYNFPGHLPNGHIIPALIAGNTLVFKPSELSPYTAEFMVDLWQQTGLPDGVINLLQGEIETGKALSQHASIDGLLFTGSANTGKLLHQQFAGQPEKILALEMGGNNPLIVKQASADRSLVYTIIQSAFITSGQRCTCARRLFIPTGEHGDALIDALVEASGQLAVGPTGEEPEPFMGPVVSAHAAKQLRAAYEKLIELGAQSKLELVHLETQTGLVTPGIVDVTGLALPDEEYFGPLLQIIRYDDFDQAIDMANQTRFGLAAGLLGGTTADYQHFQRRIRAGIVNWNRQTTGASSNAPFGGVGVSGNHRASAYYAADYCAYPVASLEADEMENPETLPPGMTL